MSPHYSGSEGEGSKKDKKEKDKHKGKDEKEKKEKKDDKGKDKDKKDKDEKGHKEKDKKDDKGKDKDKKDDKDKKEKKDKDGKDDKEKKDKKDKDGKDKDKKDKDGKGDKDKKDKKDKDGKDKKSDKEKDGHKSLDGASKQPAVAGYASPPQGFGGSPPMPSAPPQVGGGPPMPVVPSHLPGSGPGVAPPPPSGFRLPLSTTDAFPPPQQAGQPPYYDADGISPLFLGSALLPNSVQPCKIGPHLNPAAAVSHGGMEYPHNGRYDLLPFVPEQMEFVPTSHGVIPPGRRPIEGGYEETGAKLYHGVGTVNGVKVPGKTGEHLGGCVAVFGGIEHVLQENYDILCWRY